MKSSFKGFPTSRHRLKSGGSRGARTVLCAAAATLFLLPAPASPSFADGSPAILPTQPTSVASPTYNVALGGDIQAAINAASSAGGGTVNLAAGTYNISTPIVPKSNVTLKGQGSGAGGTVIYNSLGVDMVIMVDGRAGGIDDAIFQNLSVDCALTNNQRNYTADPGKNYGVYITDTSAANNRVLLDDVQVSRCAVGLHVKGTTNLTVQNSYIHDNGGWINYFHNVYLRRVSKANLQNNIFSDSSTGNGVNISYSDNITVQGCTMSNNHFRGVRAANSSYIDVLNNSVNGNGDAGIIMNAETAGVDQFRILSNTVTSNKVGISTSSNSSNGSVWYNKVSGNVTNLSLQSASTSFIGG